jgi:hypothetical protein
MTLRGLLLFIHRAPVDLDSEIKIMVHTEEGKIIHLDRINGVTILKPGQRMYCDPVDEPTCLMCLEVEEP